MEKALRGHKGDGYPNAWGYDPTRKAIAEYQSTEVRTFETRDVVLTHGTSGALEMVSCHPPAFVPKPLLINVV